MYNSNVPSRAELPSSQQLLRSTIIAAIVAAVLLVTVVLPAEYGKDLTGIGRVLGLTEMGQIKTELAREAAADAAADAGQRSESTAAAGATALAPISQAAAATTTAPATKVTTPAPARSATSSANWRDELRFTLAPGQGIEIKLVMKEGEKALYAWAVEGGVVNYDTHGDGGGQSISYVKGRAVPADEGELVAAFTGNHGWFWRNRGKEDVRVTLRTGGQYSELKRPM
jgi:hypothetical protein